MQGFIEQKYSEELTEEENENYFEKNSENLMSIIKLISLTNLNGCITYLKN